MFRIFFKSGFQEALHFSCGLAEVSSVRGTRALCLAPISGGATLSSWTQALGLVKAIKKQHLLRGSSYKLWCESSLKGEMLPQENAYIKFQAYDRLLVWERKSQICIPKSVFHSCWSYSSTGTEILAIASTYSNINWRDMMWCDHDVTIYRELKRACPPIAQSFALEDDVDVRTRTQKTWSLAAKVLLFRCWHHASLLKRNIEMRCFHVFSQAAGVPQTLTLPFFGLFCGVPLSFLLILLTQERAGDLVDFLKGLLKRSPRQLSERPVGAASAPKHWQKLVNIGLEDWLRSKPASVVYVFKSPVSRPVTESGGEEMVGWGEKTNVVLFKG